MSMGTFKIPKGLIPDTPPGRPTFICLFVYQPLR